MPARMSERPAGAAQAPTWTETLEASLTSDQHWTVSTPSTLPHKVQRAQPGVQQVLHVCWVRFLNARAPSSHFQVHFTDEEIEVTRGDKTCPQSP